MGHADLKKKDCPETITPVKKDNIQYDADTEDCAANGVPSHYFQPYPGYRAMIKINGRWITTHFRDCVRFANTSPPMSEYIKGCLSMDNETFQTVNWMAICKVRISHPIC